MNIRPWFRDTIGRRIALTVALAVATSFALNGLFVLVAGVYGRPSPEELGLLSRVHDIVRMVEAAPPDARPAIAAAASNDTFQVSLIDGSTADGVDLAAASEGQSPRKWMGFERRRKVFVDTADANLVKPALRLDPTGVPYIQALSVEVNGGNWLRFGSTVRTWGLNHGSRIFIGISFLLVSIVAVSAIAGHQSSKPVRRFTEAVQRFGTDPRATSIPETGPYELRGTIAAFNAMQAQIQRFIDDRTAMLAAISHDLRTPLTKMRLRGEFVDDPEQRARLFRDVDDMQAMVDGALAFFRDDYKAEATTPFNMTELLCTIADDYIDQGVNVSYTGPGDAVLAGRPFALRRAFTNLVDNAVKYASLPEIELRRSRDCFTVLVRDSGPGIPPDDTERLFKPFYRLERSRNRATGGVGLGLTSARAVVRAHGGEILLRNRSAGGLEVEVTLPVGMAVAV